MIVHQLRLFLSSSPLPRMSTSPLIWRAAKRNPFKISANHCLFNSLFAWLISHQAAVLFSHNKSATSNQPAVLFSQNKPAPAISHQPNEQAKPTSN
jgi:hypothetical protein